MQVFTRIALMMIGAAPLLASASWAVAAEAAHDDGKSGYVATPLVSDTGKGTAFQDANLVNGWGVVFNPNGAVWVADNGSGKSTLYTGSGALVPLVVTIPAAPSSGSVAGAPTGILFNSSTSFVVTKATPATSAAPAGTVSGAAAFLFASEDGVITGWAPNVDLLNARIAVDNSAAHAVYKGIAMGGNGTQLLLYATDFHNRRVDVFDAGFKPVVQKGAFEDPRLPEDYAPFGIQNINGDIYVTYAKQDAARHDDVPGEGAGYVDVYDADGRLIRRLASRDELNAPWAVALAPKSFGRFGGAVLVGNFGNGEISAYDVISGERIGRLRKADGTLLAIPGLWGFAFGNGINAQPTNELFYAAGPDREQHGVYGSITAVQADD